MGGMINYLHVTVLAQIQLGINGCVRQIREMLEEFTNELRGESLFLRGALHGLEDIPVLFLMLQDEGNTFILKKNYINNYFLHNS